MRAYADAVQRTILFFSAMVRAVFYCTFNAIVGFFGIIHHFIPPFDVSPIVFDGCKFLCMEKIEVCHGYYFHSLIFAKMFLYPSGFPMDISLRIISECSP